MSEEKIFADGFIAKRHERAPDFVACNLSIKVGEAVAFMQQHQREGWINLQVKQAKSGKYYVELDTFRPTQGEHGKAGMAQARNAIDQPLTEMGKANKHAASAAADFADDEIPF